MVYFVTIRQRHIEGWSHGAMGGEGGRGAILFDRMYGARRCIDLSALSSIVREFVEEIR